MFFFSTLYLVDMIASICKKLIEPLSIFFYHTSIPNNTIFKSMNSTHQTGRRHLPESVTFDDVSRCDEVSPQVSDIESFLRDPTVVIRVEAELTNGVLLVGPPGTGAFFHLPCLFV